MKRTVIILSFLFCLQITAAQQNNNSLTNSNSTSKLLGQITKGQLLQDPFKSWYSINHANYSVHTALVNQLKLALKDHSIKIFLGTWCGDSKREVPRFLKILEAANFPMSQLEIIALDNETETYKQSPSEEEKGLNIHRVPTFIFYKSGKEVNRIVESPVNSLEHDIHAIVQKGTYEPNYKAVSYLEQLFSKSTPDKMRMNNATILSDLSEIIEGCYELNTYAYVKLRAKQMDEAIYLFQLNATLFPYKDYVHYSLGVGYLTNGNFPSARSAFYKALSLNPDNKRALTRLEEIQSIDNTHQ